MKRAILALLFILVSSAGWAVSDDVSVLIVKKDYANALSAQIDKMSKNTIVTAADFETLANLYYLTGQKGAARLNLERARKINIFNPALNEKIGFLEKELNIPNSDNWQNRLFGKIPSFVGSNLALLFPLLFLTFWLVALLRLFVRQSFVTVVLLFHLPVILMSFPFFMMQYRAANTQKCVVMSDKLPLYKTFMDTASRTDEARVGQVYQVESVEKISGSDTHDSWIKVISKSGLPLWIIQADKEKSCEIL